MSETTPTPAATKARDDLQAAARTSYTNIAAAGARLAQLIRQAAATPDIVEHYAWTAHVILALEAVETAAAQADKDLRTAMLASLLDTGCPTVADDELTAYLAKEPAFVDVANPAGIPRDLWTNPQPAPDKAKIKAALDAGRSVPGASINVRNTMRLVIRPRKQ